jgi:Mg2+ and Co2+ transporter CorA
MVVHGVRYDAENDEFKTHELNIFLGASYLVTFHTYHSRSIDAAKENVRRHPLLMARGMDFLLHQVVDRVIDNYFPKLEIIRARSQLNGPLRTPGRSCRTRISSCAAAFRI